MPVEEVSREISALKNFSDETVFPELTKLARSVMTFPHSNAEAERIFSIVTDAKSKKRNRMGVENFNTIADVRSSFSSKGISYCTFNVTDAHLKKFNSSMNESKNEVQM